MSLIWLLLSTLIALIVALLIKKHNQQLAAPSKPMGSPHHDKLMDVNASLPLHSPSSDRHTSQGLLPFLGNIVNSAHEVVHLDLTNLSHTGLWELCNAFCLVKTGNKTTLTDQLKNFSADQQGWDGWWCHKEHKGPREEGEHEKVADNFVACNPYKLLEAENESLPPDVGRDWDGAVRIHGDISNAPSSPSPEGPQMALELQLQQVQAQLAALMAAIAGGNSGGVAPSPITVVSVPVPAPVPAHRGPGTMDSAATTTDTAATTMTTTDGPSPPTLSHQQPVSVLQGPLDYLKLGNGRSLCFSKQSVPDLPLVSFSKDLPQPMRTWDDSSPEWTPSEVVLRIQGEPIVLKHWPTVYCYGIQDATHTHWLCLAEVQLDKTRYA
ncbi:hypothetical protein EDB86DRAFT_2838378 [Lactarius hatsudake]|nr:hypothetical protein EDB86DRAFT_2838378 [Lactarius hatsudake]